MRRTATQIVIATVALIASAGCNRGTSSTPSGGQAAASTPTAPAAAPPAAGARADLGDDELGVIADADPESGQAPLKVKFTVEIAVDEEIPNATYTWDFGDGTPASHEQAPVHNYEKPGQYLATVRIAGGQGHHGWDECEIEVQPHQLPAGEQ